MSKMTPDAVLVGGGLETTAHGCVSTGVMLRKVRPGLCARDVKAEVGDKMLATVLIRSVDAAQEETMVDKICCEGCTQPEVALLQATTKK